jgi:hypothetical protein
MLWSCDYSEIEIEFERVRESSQVAGRWPRAGFYIYSGADVNHSGTGDSLVNWCKDVFEQQWNVAV